MSLTDRWDSVLNELRRTGRYRDLAPPCGVDFSSNDYLGYAGGQRSSEPDALARVTHSLADASGSDGICSTASRLLRGHHPVWDEVETKLAAWHGADAALMLTSGYIANEGLLSTVIGPGDWVASDECNHASIIDGLRLAKADKFVFRHRDVDHLESGLRDVARSRLAGRELFVVTESLFSMDGDRAPLSALAGLCTRFGAHLIVDEAHATGCFGPAGGGCVGEAGLRRAVLATVHTGGKAMGVLGAYVCGSRRLRELLINRCRHLIFTTALPPVVGQWWLDALERVRRDGVGREALHGNAAFFRRELDRGGVAAAGSDYIVPVILHDDERAVRVAAELQRRGWDVRAIRPPSVPVGSARLRISIHADHDRETLARLAAAVAELTST